VGAEEWWYRASQITSATAQASDLATTMYCMGAKLCTEANPWLARYKNPVGFAVAKTTVAAGSLILLDHYAQRGKKEKVIVTITNFAIGGAFFYIASHNLRTIERAQARTP